MFRHERLKRIEHLDIISKNAVILDPQFFDSCFFLFFRFDFGDEILSAGYDLPQAVQLGVITVRDQAALADGKRRILHKRAPDQRTYVRKRVDPVCDLFQLRRLHAGKRGLYIGQDG